jgi:hypothetical protein
VNDLLLFMMAMYSGVGSIGFDPSLGTLLGVVRRKRKERIV